MRRPNTFPCFAIPSGAQLYRCRLRTPRYRDFGGALLCFYCIVIVVAVLRHTLSPLTVLILPKNHTVPVALPRQIFTCSHFAFKEALCCNMIHSHFIHGPEALQQVHMCAWCIHLLLSYIYERSSASRLSHLPLSKISNCAFLLLALKHQLKHSLLEASSHFFRKGMTQLLQI